MENQEIVDGLRGLGFDSGWVVQGSEIIVWENDRPIPSAEEIKNAAKDWQKTKLENEKKLEIQKQSILERLGITEEEAKLLLG